MDWCPDQDALRGKVAVVAGATRGGGRGIAAALGEAGATVICTGRSSRDGGMTSDYDRPETIEETAEMVTRLGGLGVAMQVDHLDPQQVKRLADRLRSAYGSIDVLVNDIWGAEKLKGAPPEWNTPIWDHDLDRGLRIVRLGIETHLITSHYLLPLLIEKPGGLLVNLPTGSWPTMAEDAAAAGIRATGYRVPADGPTLAVISRLLESGDVRVFVDQVFELDQARAERRRQAERLARAAADVVGAARVIERQLEGRQIRAEVVAPVADQRVEARAGQLGALRAGVVGVLERQRRQRRRRAERERGVQRGHLADEHVVRPAVPHDVVDGEHDDELVGGEPERAHMAVIQS